MSKRTYIIPIFVPHLGCPHACVFCNQRQITGQTVRPTPAGIAQTISTYLATMPIDSGRRIEVAFYGGSFTALPADMQLELLAPATRAWQQGKIDGIRLSTRPDCISDEILSMLARQGVDIVELGAQSLDQEVLKQANRGHTPGDVIRASRLVLAAGLQLGIQMMIGLPGDTRERTMDTVTGIVQIGPHFVRIYPALVLKNTALHAMYLAGAYRPLSLAEAVDWSKEALIKFIQANIPVIRIGLQSTASLMQEGEIAAGPWHPAFGELVYSALTAEHATVLLRQWLTGRNDLPEQVVLFTPPSQVSQLVGQHQANLKRWQADWPIKKIKVKPAAELPPLAIGITSSEQKFPDLLLTREEFISNYRIN